MTLTLSWKSRRFTTCGGRHRPDAALLFNHRETWGPGRLDSPDQCNLGQAALESIGLQPHGGVRQALVTGECDADFAQRSSASEASEAVVPTELHHCVTERVSGGRASVVGGLVARHPGGLRTPARPRGCARQAPDHHRPKG